MVILLIILVEERTVALRTKIICSNLIYKVEPKDKPQGSNIMAIDLGLDNLATITLKDNSKSCIIDGKVIKSENRYYNKKITKLQKIRMKQVGSKQFKDTKQIKSLRLKRRNLVTDYLHKASRKVVELATKNNVNTK